MELPLVILEDESPVEDFAFEDFHEATTDLPREGSFTGNVNYSPFRLHLAVASSDVATILAPRTGPIQMIPFPQWPLKSRRFRVLARGTSRSLSRDDGSFTDPVDRLWTARAGEQFWMARD